MDTLTAIVHVTTVTMSRSALSSRIKIPWFNLESINLVNYSAEASNSIPISILWSVYPVFMR